MVLGNVIKRNPGKEQLIKNGTNLAMLPGFLAGGVVGERSSRRASVKPPCTVLRWYVRNIPHSPLSRPPREPSNMAN